MINLGNMDGVDAYILEELQKSGINIVSGEQVKDESVSYSVTGELNGWELTRKWSYWEAVAKDSEGLPLQIATELHNKEYPVEAENDEMLGSAKKEIDTYGDVIRAKGHYGTSLVLEDWNFPKAHILAEKLEETGKRNLSYDELIGISGGNSIPPEFITTYHIGTQEGLNEFARVVKSL